MTSKSGGVPIFPSGRGAARSPRRRCRDRDAGRSPDRRDVRARHRPRGLRCSCGTRDARAMAGQRGPAMARGAAPLMGRAQPQPQPHGGSDSRRSCGRCGSRAGRGHRRARERCRAQARRRVRRARHGGIGAGRAWRSARERSLAVCIVRATGFAPHVAAGRPCAAGWVGDGPSSYVDFGARAARHGVVRRGRKQRRAANRAATPPRPPPHSPPLPARSARVAPSSMRTPP